MTELCEIAHRYKTDKCPQIKHHFTEWYYQLFPDRYAVKKVLEIGIGYPGCMYPDYRVGASLRMWQEWFPNAMIYGADIDPGLMFTEERIRTFVCDQRNKADLDRVIRSIGTDIDLLIDDGDHDPLIQQMTCAMLMPMVDKKVIYSIEDAAYTPVDLLSPYDITIYQPKHRKYKDDRMIVVRNK